jgi:hypothetical protein
MASLFGATGTTLAHRGKGGGEAAMLG